MAVDTRRVTRKAGAPRPPQTYSLQYVEEADRAQRRRRGHMRRRSRLGVRNAGWLFGRATGSPLRYLIYTDCLQENRSFWGTDWDGV